MAGDDFCYLTTTGRRSGRPHEIEIWYAEATPSTSAASSTSPRTLYLLAGAGDGSDWVRNLDADPRCTVRIGARDSPPASATGRLLGEPTDEARTARTLVFDKYQPRNGGDLTSWRERSLPVALDLDAT